MPRPKILSAILIVVPATVCLTTQTSLSDPTAETCRTRPGLSTPRGSHWYYRLNRTDKRHCWYLAAEGMPVHSRGRAATSSPSSAGTAAQKNNAADNAFDAGANAVELPSAPPPQGITAQIVSAQTAPAPAEITEVIRSGPPLAEHQAVMDFAARWPDLPKSRELPGPELVPVSASYAENNAAPDAAAPISVNWPIVAGARALQPAAGGVLFQSVSLAGGCMMALLLAGWMFRTGRWPFVSHADADGHAFAVAGPPPEAPVRRGDPRGRPPTPTDPADDLKGSLAELMRDLRRAGANLDSLRPFAPSARQTQHSPLQPKASTGGSGDQTRHGFAAAAMACDDMTAAYRARNRARSA